ncbi:MAG TPA: 50S ribosomal protein L9, partial [Oligoflexia bacterium]|nr:50S ribosomal protein L9 [Oligoflexia bacterium]
PRLSDSQALRSATDHHHRALARKREKNTKDATELATKLEAYSVTIRCKVGENDKLFGSVTAADIAAALAKGGYVIDKRQVQIDDPIKQAGVATVKVKLSPEISAQVKVWVVGDNA